MEIDHNSKTISDKVTVVGEVEHALYHARKSASVKADDRDATIFTKCGAWARLSRLLVSVFTRQTKVIQKT